ASPPVCVTRRRLPAGEDRGAPPPRHRRGDPLAALQRPARRGCGVSGTNAWSATAPSSRRPFVEGSSCWRRLYPAVVWLAFRGSLVSLIFSHNPLWTILTMIPVL